MPPETRKDVSPLKPGTPEEASGYYLGSSVSFCVRTAQVPHKAAATQPQMQLGHFTSLFT